MRHEDLGTCVVEIMNALPATSVIRRSIISISSIRWFRIVLTIATYSGVFFPCMITHVRGGDLRNTPVPFRINLSLDRVSSYTDTIARSASAAHPLGSSVNPASYDFLRDPPFDFKGVGAFTSNIGVFNRGMWANGLSANAAYRLTEAGTISALFVRTDSHNAVSEQGDEFFLRSNQFSLGYSQRILQNFSLGANTRITEGSL